MKQQKLKLECIKYAAKVVATMDVENKSKALFDLAEQIYRYATPDKCVEEEPQKPVEWFGTPIYPYGAPIPCITPPYEVTCTSGTSVIDTMLSTVDPQSEHNKQKE